MDKTNPPQVKICGLTRVDEAEACVRLGADAIGLVFFPKSPRYVTDRKALEISSAVSDRAKSIGVFVNASYGEILRRVEGCGLSGVQLHGRETPELVEKLAGAGIPVIKVLFVDGTPPRSDAELYTAAAAFLVECSRGPLPGGNAMAWNWGEVRDFGMNHRLVLAGGLSPKNVAEAISSALPDAVDVSSGVEKTPGRKDLEKVAAFIRAVSSCRGKLASEKKGGRVF